MNFEEKIDVIYEKMQTLPLSDILPMILPIALEFKDYEGYCILTYCGKPIANDIGANKTLQQEMQKVLLGEGMTGEAIEVLQYDSFEKYLKLRSIDKDQVLGLCAKEMENRLNQLEDMLKIIDTPDGLAPLDMYYLSERNTTQKLKALQSRQQVEQQYAVLQSYLTTKLVDYRRKAINCERKKELEKGIKNSKDIFVIHGHDEAKRRELVSLLKDRFNLNPIVLLDQPDQGLTIIEKFEKYASNCSYAFALFTPDDIVTNGDKQYFQARPNVIFELGWFYANLGRSRVCILDQAGEQSKIFSDLQGILRMQFNANVSEKCFEIERELKSLGII